MPKISPKADFKKNQNYSQKVLLIFGITLLALSQQQQNNANRATGHNDLF